MFHLQLKDFVTNYKAAVKTARANGFARHINDNHYNPGTLFESINCVRNLPPSAQTLSFKSSLLNFRICDITVAGNQMTHVLLCCWGLYRLGLQLYEGKSKGSEVSNRQELFFEAQCRNIMAKNLKWDPHSCAPTRSSLIPVLLVILSITQIAFKV